MESLIIKYEVTILLASMIILFLLMAGLELLLPKRHLAQKRISRWIPNIGLTLLDLVIVRFLVPFTVINAAIYAYFNQFGIFYFFEVNKWVSIIFSFILLDYIMYILHYAFHKVEYLWSFHKIHHTDIDMDASTAFRFHPIEAIITMGVKIAAILIFGMPIITVVIYEIILNVYIIFVHSNVKIPIEIDKALRNFIVTPDMHRIHHSVLKKDNSFNFCFNFSIWDRLLHTYKDLPAEGHLEMIIGLDEYRNQDKIGFLNLLGEPFKND